MWKWWALLSAVFAALTALLAKLGVKDVDSNVATAVRTCVVLLIATGVVAATGNLGSFASLTRWNLLFLTLSGAATGLSWLFYFKAIQLGDISKVGPVDKLSVAFVILFGILFLHEPAEPKTLIGAALILAGSVAILL